MDTETLQKLLDDGLAVMEPNDPAKANLNACLKVCADLSAHRYSVYFYHYLETPSREAFGSGSTPEEALEDFRANYRAPLTKEGQIASLRAQIAALEGGLK